MKNLFKLVLNILLIALLIITPLIIGQSEIYYAQNEGQWVLKDVDFDLRGPHPETVDSMGEGSASAYSLSESSGDVFAASASWTQPKNSYRGGEIIILTLAASIDAYVWNGTNDGDERTLYVKTTVGAIRYNYVWQSGPSQEDSSQNQEVEDPEPEIG